MTKMMIANDTIIFEGTTAELLEIMKQTAELFGDKSPEKEPEKEPVPFIKPATGGFAYPDFTKEIDNLLAEILFGKKTTTKITRSEAIDKAKKDVEDLTKRMSSHLRVTEGNTYLRNYVTKPSFRVDKSTGLVEASVINTFPTLGPTVLNKGVAKLAPGDVFNSHIGRAISLRRALGLEVPEYLIKTPQPTEPEVGDKVRSKAVGYTTTLTGRVPEKDLYGYGKAFTHSFSIGWLGADQMEIIDDSKEAK